VSKQDATISDTPLPSAVDAERVLLASVFIDNAYWDQVSALPPDAWSLDSHRRIRMAMKRLHDANTAIDQLTVSMHLQDRHEIEAVGGWAYITDLDKGVPRHPAIEDYVRIVREKMMLRRTILICTSTLSMAQDQSESVLDVISYAQGEIEKLCEPVMQSNKAPVKAFMPNVIQEVVSDYIAKKQPTIPSGNAWFDAKTGGGYRMGKYTIVAARPKIGKSSFAVTSTVYNCQRGKRVVWFSMEMDRKELSLNFVPYLTDLPNIVCVRPWLRTPEQQDTVLEALETIERDWNLEIHDGELDCDQVCWIIDKEGRRGEETLLIGDHFGLIAGGEKDIRKRYVEHSERIRKKIKPYHKTMAMLMLFQLNEVPREFADKRPQRSDIGESKKPLQDCYAALFLHRYQDKETLKMTRRTNQNLELIRGGGSPGNVDGEFDTKRLEFLAQAEMEYEDQYDPQKD